MNNWQRQKKDTSEDSVLAGVDWGRVFCNFGIALFGFWFASAFCLGMFLVRVVSFILLFLNDVLKLPLI